MSVQSVGGLASGLPVGEIIDSLIQADRRATVQIERRKELTEGRLEAVRTLNMRLLAVDTESFYLRRASTFNARSVTSSNSSAMAVSANATAHVGDYRVRIDSLARAEEQATAAVAADAVFSGSLEITVGEGATWEHHFAEGSSLADIAQQLNRDASAGVTAQVVSAGADQQRLVLRSRATGAEQTMVFGGDLAAEGGVLAADTMQVITSASDASATLRIGEDPEHWIESTVTSSTNTISDLINGVTITAQEAGETFHTVSVDNDPSAPMERIQAFVEAYNEAVTYYRANSSYDQGNKEAGVLFSEGSLRSGMDRLVRAVSGRGGADSGSITSLAGMGITLNRNTGLLEVNETVLSQTLAADPEGVRQLFIEGELGSRIDQGIKGLTRNVDGVLSNMQSRLSSSIGDMERRIEQMDARLAQRRQRYEAQFLAMEKMISQLQSQERFIVGQIEAFQNMAAGPNRRR